MTITIPMLGYLEALSGDSPAEIFKDLLTIFETWIGRVGGIVAFVGAVKLAGAARSEDEREVIQAAFTMAAGFMISISVGSWDLFNIPNTYTAASATKEFKSITNFIGSWTSKVGMAVMLFGSINLGFSIKDNNAASKVLAIKAMATGGIIVAVSGMLSSFV